MSKFNLDKFKGVFVAFYATYDNNGEVCTEAAKKLARFYADKGVKGLYLCGSSGEGFLLNVEERKKVVEAVMEEIRGELTIIVHVGAAATRDSVELSKHAEGLEVDALSAVPCVYYTIPESSIENNWNTIINSTSLPFIIYNIPQLTGYNLSMNLMKRMAENQKVIGIKNTSLSSYQIQQFKSAGGENFIVFNGPDEQYLAGRIMGAEAGIGGTYGVMPELFVHIEKCFAKGDIKEAQKWQFRVNEIINELLTFPYLYGPAKEIVKLRGVDIGIPRLPIEGIKPEENTRVKAIYEKIMKYVEEVEK